MSKSIKLQDDTFLDSTGIVHNKELLSDILNNATTDINRCDLNSFTSKFVAGYGHNLVNAPSESLNLGHLLSIPRYDAVGYVTQYFTPLGTTDIYIRKCEAGTWGDWIKLGGEVYEYVLTAVTSTISTNAWKPLGVNLTTDKLPKGKYLIIFSGSIMGSTGTGYASINPYLDGARTSEDTRQSIPIYTGLLMSCQASVVTEFTTDSTHTINMYIYSTLSITKANHLKVKFIKIC